MNYSDGMFNTDVDSKRLLEIELEITKQRVRIEELTRARDSLVDYPTRARKMIETLPGYDKIREFMTMPCNRGCSFSRPQFHIKTINLFKIFTPSDYKLVINSDTIELTKPQIKQFAEIAFKSFKKSVDSMKPFVNAGQAWIDRFNSGQMRPDFCGFFYGEGHTVIIGGRLNRLLYELPSPEELFGICLLYNLSGINFGWDVTRHCHN